MVFVRIGMVTGTFGLDGVLKVTPMTEHPQLLEESEFLMLAKDGVPCRSLRIQEVWWHNGNLLYSLDGITASDMAKQLNGLEVVVPETYIPEANDDEVYWYMIEGADVVDEMGNKVGTLVDYIESSSTDIFRIKLNDGNYSLISNNKTHVLSIDSEKKEVVINMDGLVNEDI